MGRVNVNIISTCPYDTSPLRSSVFSGRHKTVVVLTSFRMGHCANLHRRQTVAYLEVVFVTALLFDFCITFDPEVCWTWGRK
ncbi:hypothetical protein BDR03DRAFT_1092553 [Suillus americanus]|nr:hypothetical protein BDR03DRAFT_1092553 [Suillus americanus]